MQRLLIGLLLMGLIQCNQKDPHDPLTYFNRSEQEAIIYKTIRYSAKLPPNCNQQIKFDTAYDAYYKRQAADYTFLKIFQREDGAYDFLISRPARSLTPMFEGIGGQFQLNDRDSLILYNETFRMWKMSYKDLQERGDLLFGRMVKGEDLTMFYSKTAGDKYIEFPDDRFTFDQKLRRWHDSAFDSTIIN